MDATALLTQDHEEVEQLFRKYEQAGGRAVKTRQNVAQKIIDELTIHTEIEEEIFYPAVRKKIRAAKEEVLESVEEHHVAEVLIAEIKQLSPQDETFDAKVTVLIENVRTHKQEEETELFPQAREAFSQNELDKLGQELQRAKERKQHH